MCRQFVLLSVAHRYEGRHALRICSLICDFYYLGARETDYPAGEEVLPNSEAGQVGDGILSSTNSSSAGGESVLGGITVVGCVAEGTAAIPQTVDRETG